MCSLSLTMDPHRTARVNLKMAFFNPFKDEYVFYNQEKKKIMRTAFTLFYMEELRKSLKEIVVLNCQICNQDIAGKEAPKTGPHTCMDFKTLRQAYDEHGDCAMGQISRNNKTRWSICQKWWNFIFTLPANSSIQARDAVRFAQDGENDLFDVLFCVGWGEEFDNMIERFSWTKPDSDNIAYMLYELSKW